MVQFSIMLSFFHIFATTILLVLMSRPKAELYLRGRSDLGEVLGACQLLMAFICVLSLISYGRAAGFW